MWQGYKVGLYTSPYLEKFTERIRINGENIPEEDVARIATLLEKIKQTGRILPSIGFEMNYMAFTTIGTRDYDFMLH